MKLSVGVVQAVAVGGEIENLVAPKLCADDSPVARAE